MKNIWAIERLDDAADAVVIGAGVVGLSCALMLARCGMRVIVLEQAASLGDAQSGRNSGVIHAGIYYEPGSLKARLCVRGRELVYAWCRERNIPCLQTGKLLVAATRQEMAELRALRRLATRNGVRGLEIFGAQELHRRMPLVKGTGGMYVPQTGVIDAAALVAAIKAECEQSGVIIQLHARAVSIPEVRIQKQRIVVRVAQCAPGTKSQMYDVATYALVNAAGLYADRVAQMLNESNPWQLAKVRGEYVSFQASSRPELGLTAMPVYGPPRTYRGADGTPYITLGVHTTPTFDILDRNGTWGLGQTVIVGPTARPIKHFDDERLDQHQQSIAEIIAPVQAFFPELRPEDCTRGQIGIQARLAGPLQDFVIERDSRYPWCIHLVGIDSPGLTASLAIGEEVAEMSKNKP